MTSDNGEKFIKEQIDSILSQLSDSDELIISDDGSSDKTIEIINSYNDSRIKLLNHKKNPSFSKIKCSRSFYYASANFENAIKCARGDYIFLSDQDDIWEKDKLAIQAQSIGDKMLCSGFSVPFSTDGYPVQSDMRIPNVHLIRDTYICAIPGHSMLFKRQLLAYMQGGETLPLYYDWQILNVAAAAESIVFVDKVLVHFRRHNGAATASRPVGNRLLSGGGWRYVTLSLFRHRELQKEVRRRFTTVLPFLEKLPFSTQSLKDAIYMSRLQLEKGPCSFFKRVVFFIGHSRSLFYAEEPRKLVRWLRAAFFVYSCGYYYRAYIK